MFRRDDDYTLVWFPDAAKFRDLVVREKLKGKIDGDDVHLAALTAADLQALTSGALGMPFGKTSPVIFRRVAP